MNRFYYMHWMTDNKSCASTLKTQYGQANRRTKIELNFCYGHTFWCDRNGTERHKERYESEGFGHILNVWD